MVNPLSVEDYLTQLGDPDPDVRRNAAWNLGRFRDGHIAPALLAHVNDPNAAVRVRVVESLGNFTHEAVVGALIDALYDADSGVRAAAAHSLGNRADERAVPALIPRLSDPDDRVREAVADALGRLRTHEAFVALAQALMTEQMEAVRYALYRALALQSGDDATHAVDALMGVAAQHPPTEPAVRALVAQVFGALGGAGALAIPLLSEWQHDPDPTTADMVAWALRRVQGA